MKNLNTLFFTIAGGVAVAVIMRKVDAGEIPWLAGLVGKKEEPQGILASVAETETESETYA